MPKASSAAAYRVRCGVQIYRLEGESLWAVDSQQAWIGKFLWVWLLAVAEPLNATQNLSAVYIFDRP